MRNVGEYINYLIKKNGIKQSDVARSIGVSRQRLNYVISKQRELSISLALKLESFFNLPEGTLLKLQIEESILNYKYKLKNELLEELLRVNAFWSYADISINNINDEELIEKSFIYLDMRDISKLFELYSKDYLKKVWRERMVIQGDYLFALNVMIALYYFDIKHPEKYIKQIEAKHLNSYA